MAGQPAKRTALTFAIEPDGTITAKGVGAVTYAWLTSEIEAALRIGVSGER